MQPALRRLVRERAAKCCEYCGLSEEHAPFVPFHVEHIVPRQHGGGDDPSNLALACHHCNLHKGPNLAGIDPETDSLCRLFHPRLDDWSQHFELGGALIRGLSPTGRATIRALNMNAADRVKVRSELKGRRPPE